MLKVITLFTGIGAQEAALKRLGLDFEIVGISEIDKYAIQSYEAINGSVRNYGDITQIERLDYADLWTYSFPCQDLSFAGKQRGISEETRSGLLLHVERLLTESVLYGTQPKYLLLENVKALVSKKFMPDFQRWLDKLEQLGYNNYWQVLNAKDYDIPQNRELTSSLQKLSYEATSEKEKLCYMWETDESFRVLRETLSEIQEIWKSINIKSQNKYRIRKLTARECWRLMAFTDIEFDCAKLSGVSDSQLYRQAGNSIVVDVLVGIFKGLFDDRP